MKLILCLDGGGIRERFTIELLHRLEQESGKKIYEMFDMVVGVSAGAMMAALIATKSYGDLNDPMLTTKTSKMFGKKTSIGLFETIYTGSGKKDELRKLFKNQSMASLKMPCAILAATMQGEATVFTDQESNANSTLIREVVDASSAAPVFFPPTKINGVYYVDGGIVTNDPVFSGIEYTRKLWPDTDLCDIAIFSIGTGHAKEPGEELNPNFKPKEMGFIAWLKAGLLTILTNTKHNYNEPIIRLLVGSKNYLRITSGLTAGMDDLSHITEQELKANADKVWKDHHVNIMNWLQEKIKKP